MSRRGFTLIEQMITVAIIGILVGAAGVTGNAQRSMAQAELQRERALQLVEYRASCIASGVAPSAATESALAENLPRAEVSVRWNGRLAAVSVTWHSANGRDEQRTLSVFGAGAK